LDSKPKLFGEIWIDLVSPQNLNYLDVIVVRLCVAVSIC